MIPTFPPLAPQTVSGEEGVIPGQEEEEGGREKTEGGEDRGGMEQEGGGREEGKKGGKDEEDGEGSKRGVREGKGKRGRREGGESLVRGPIITASTLSSTVCSMYQYIRFTCCLTSSSVTGRLEVVVDPSSSGDEHIRTLTSPSSRILSSRTRLGYRID